MKNFRHAEYLEKVIRTENLPKTVRFVVKNLKKRIKDGLEFEAIAFRGMSGALIAPPVAMRLKKDLLLVRKPGDNNHSGRFCEGNTLVKSYIIIDDLVASGKTLRAIKEAVKDFTDGPVICRGAYLYAGQGEGYFSDQDADTETGAA